MLLRCFKTFWKHKTADLMKVDICMCYWYRGQRMNAFFKFINRTSQLSRHRFYNRLYDLITSFILKWFPVNGLSAELVHRCAAMSILFTVSRNVFFMAIFGGLQADRERLWIDHFASYFYLIADFYSFNLYSFRCPTETVADGVRLNKRVTAL